jgi:hypothetical protein
MTTLKLKKGCRAIKNFVGLKTAFIEVVIGPPVERQIALTDDTLVVPLGPLGNKHHVEWGNLFTNLVGIPTDANFQISAEAQGAMFNDATAIVYRSPGADEFRAATEGRSSMVQRHRALLGLFAATEHKPILRLTWNEPARGRVEFLAPLYRGLSSRHGLDPVSPDFIRFCATERRNDDQLYYFLGLLTQAHGIEDLVFRIARYYSLLEAIAGPIQSQFERQAGEPRARSAIRYTIGYFIDFDIPRFTILPAEDFEFDHIELAGRIRHKIFHGGGALTRADVTKALEPGLQLLARRPDMIAHWLRRDCELEIVRWARRESRAWLAQNGTTYELPARNPNYDGKSLNKPLISSSAVANSSIGSVFVKVEGADIGVVRLNLGS